MRFLDRRLKHRSFDAVSWNTNSHLDFRQSPSATSQQGIYEHIRKLMPLQGRLSVEYRCQLVAVHNPLFRNASLAMHEPVGVVAIICPSEAPLLGFLSLVFLAIAVGNAHPVKLCLIQILQRPINVFIWPTRERVDLEQLRLLMNCSV